MKKILSTLAMLLVVSLSSTTFVACSSDSDDVLEIKGSDVYGLWTTTAVESNGKWVDVTNPAYKDLRASARFYKDGTYWGFGALGTGYGTWSVSDNIISTFVDGEEYIKYKIYSLDGDNMKGVMYDSNSSLNFKAKREEK